MVGGSGGWGSLSGEAVRIVLWVYIACMTLRVPVGYHNAVYRFALDGDAEEMVFSLGVDNVSADGPSVIAEGLFDAAVDAGSFASPANMCSVYRMTGVTLYTAELGGSLVTEHNEISQGTASAAPLPSNCAVLVQKRTGVGGRQFRGRIFCPPFQSGESNISATGDHGGTLAELQSEWGQFLAAIVGEAYSPVLFHTAEGVPPTPITQLIVDGKIATQRRRLR